MNNYKTLKFPKNYLIYEEGNYPKDVFYIITKGKAKSYSSNSKNYEREYDVGFIAGLSRRYGAWGKAPFTAL